MDTSLIVIIICTILAILLIAIYIKYGREQAKLTFDIGGGSPRAAGGSDASVEKGLSHRVMGLGIAVSAVFVGLIGKLWSMQLVSSEEYTEQAERNRTSTVYTQAPRGRILDRHGREIVGNRPSLTLVAAPEVIEDETELRLIGNLTGMPVQAVRRKAQDTTGGQQGDRTIAVDVSRRVVAFVGEHPEAFPSVRIQERTLRSYPYGSLAAHVVGYTGTVTSQQLEESAKQQEDEGSVVYRSGDVVGQSGVEYQYESVLQGVRGEQTVYVDAHGKVLDYSTVIEPRAGSDLMLTIDLDIQKAAEESLARVIKQVRGEGYSTTGGSVVALDCTNGEVIAMASAPTFSPNSFTGGISQADWDALQAENAHFPMMNRAISGQYPSGSVIKPLSMFAALKNQIANAGSTWMCNGWWSWSGSRNDPIIMKCWLQSGHGLMNVPDGITFSCDVVFYEIGKGFYYSDNPQGLQETFHQYGLGALTGIDLPAEASGRIPDPDWKWKHFEGYSDEQRTWQGGDNCNIAIGQGDLLVTCLQMACAYCSIANKGPIWQPHVMKGVKAALGEGFISQWKNEVTHTIDETDLARDLVERGMEGVVYRESPSQSAHWFNFDQQVRGKTGTAEQVSIGEPIGWFAAYVPAENPKYVVASNMDRVFQGASSAMYVVRDVMGALYNQPDVASDGRN